MQVADLNLKEALEFRPTEGILNLGSQRMVIMPADSFGKLIEFIMTIADENMVHMFLFQMGEEAGKRDAEILKQDFSPDTDMDWAALGPTIHSWEGIVRAVPESIEIDREKPFTHWKGTWDNSFMADQWLKRFGTSKESVCSLLTGYAQGYTTVVVGHETEAREPLCQAKGDDRCMFEIKLKGDWED
ncbi:MAG: XylR N-terminal domain-containing protein [Candidatus Thorarchaeota archaeon]|jgi:predicted hydrocarbon binding protein